MITRMEFRSEWSPFIVAEGSPTIYFVPSPKVRSHGVRGRHGYIVPVQTLCEMSFEVGPIVRFGQLPNGPLVELPYPGWKPRILPTAHQCSKWCAVRCFFGRHRLWDAEDQCLCCGLWVKLWP